jgi:hypothetical protein
LALLSRQRFWLLLCGIAFRPRRYARYVLAQINVCLFSKDSASTSSTVTWANPKFSTINWIAMPVRAFGLRSAARTLTSSVNRPIRYPLP